MIHTTEPWKYRIDHRNTVSITGGLGPQAIIEPCKMDEINAARIVSCVNGCAGLNPAAYRECVEALKKVKTHLYEAINKRADDLSGTWHDVTNAIDQAEKTRESP